MNAHKLQVSPVERSLIRKMEVPAVISQGDHAKLKYFVGFEEGKSDEVTHPAIASRLQKFHMQSRSTTFVGIQSSIRVEDDLILRYVPYFGDNESGKEIDVKYYDKIHHEEACERSGLDGEVPEYFLRLVIAECGASAPVFTALRNVCGFNRAFSDYGEIKKDYDAKRLAAKRIAEARAAVKDRAIDGVTDAVHPQAAKLLRESAVLGASERDNKCLEDRLAPPPTFFESNFTRRHGDAVARRLGVRSTGVYAEMSEHYRDLFCRMCYKYDCPEHGIEHPQPIQRANPINPPVRLSPVAFATAKISAPEEKERGEAESMPALDDIEARAVKTSSPESSAIAFEAEVDSHGTDGNESASSGVSVEKRRSARSQTIASTLATSFTDGFLLAERSRSSRPSRVQAASKVADEIEYLDDSHSAMVESKINSFVRGPNACSELCWKLSGTVAAASAAEKTTSEVSELELNAATSAFKSSCSPSELVLLQKARDVVGDNACMIASIVSSIACKDLHWFLEKERLSAFQASVPASVVVETPVAKKGRPSGSRGGRESLKRNRNQKLKEKGANHEFEPCSHGGVCGSSDCSCITRDHMCEKACSCSRDCPNRYEWVDMRVEARHNHLADKCVHVCCVVQVCRLQV